TPLRKKGEGCFAIRSGTGTGSLKLSGISFRKCRGGIEAAREAPVRPEALPCPLCRLVFGGPPICSADRAPRRFFAAFAVFGKLHISWRVCALSLREKCVF